MPSSFTQLATTATTALLPAPARERRFRPESSAPSLLQLYLLVYGDVCRGEYGGFGRRKKKDGSTIETSLKDLTRLMGDSLFLSSAHAEGAKPLALPSALEKVALVPARQTQVLHATVSMLPHFAHFSSSSSSSSSSSATTSATTTSTSATTSTSSSFSTPLDSSALSVQQLTLVHSQRVQACLLFLIHLPEWRDGEER